MIEKGDRAEIIGEADDGTLEIAIEKPDGALGLAHGTIVQEGRPLDPRGEQLLYITDGVVTDTCDLGHDGPARVATKAYRDGWDAIFGDRPPVPNGELN